MRDYINRLSRGNSIIKVPKLSCSEEQITMDIMCNTVATGSFICDATDKVYGMVYADNERVKIFSEQFGGTHIITEYQVDASGLEENDEIEGTFTVVCNAGEKKIPFVFRCMKENQDDIRNHVKTEAVVLHIDNEENTIIHKDEAEQFECVLIKSGTEETEIDIYADADFIELEKDSLSTDDFAGDRAVIKYIVNPQKMHAGNNYGYIHIVSYTQHLKINVSVICKKADESEDFEVRREEKLAQYKLTKLYLDFRMKKIKKEKWIAESMQTVDRIRGIKGIDVFYDIVQIQLLMASGREETATQIYNNIKKDIVGRIGENVELYCYFLYVSTLIVREEEYTAQVLSQVKKFFENGYDTYRILWILFYLSTDSDNKSIRLVRIKDVINSGCISPVMYIEAMNIINAQPVLLRVLNQFEMQVINYGCRNDIISEKLAMQIADVVANEKNININTLIILKKIYDKYEKDEILTVLVTQMVRMGMTGENCFEIYEKGVLRGLKITRLYEFYIASMPKKTDRQLPKIVLMYFAYDNTLTDADKAFLYANVVTGRDSYYKNIYEGYERNIEIYVYEQLKAGNISDNLVVLYKALLKTQLVCDDTGIFVSKMPYMYRMQCFSDVVRYVHVRYPQFTEETVYELSGETAYICMYGSDCEITFECIDGQIRKDTIDYDIEKVFDIQQYAEVFEAAGDYGKNNSRIIMSRICEMRKNSQYTQETLKLYKTIKKEQGISEQYKQQINAWMIDYYYHYYEEDDFWHEYNYVDTDNLTKKDAGKLIEILIDSSMYSQAYEIAGIYGCCMAKAAKLLKMTDYILTNVSDGHSQIIDEITQYIFRHNIYNEPVLSYMCEYYNGTNDEMYAVWKSAVNYNVNVLHMSERILAQMMYTGVHTGRFTEVFADYYSKIPDMLIVKAYLSYNSQFYLLRQKKANDIVFRVIEECMGDGYGLPECCYVAWLKNLSRNPVALREDTSEKELAQSVLNELCEHDRIYGFFKKFKGILDLPYNMQGLTIVEYIADPDDKVSLTYSINGADRLVQVMKSNEWGIFTCRFNLFYGDSLEYTFIVNDSNEQASTEPVVCEYKDIPSENTDGRIDMLNDCLASRQQHDLTTLRKLMYSYCVEEYVTREMFTIVK